MAFSRIFMRKYGDFIDRINSTNDFIEKCDTWCELIDQDEFVIGDALQLMDYLVELSSQTVPEMGNIRKDFVSELFTLIFNDYSDWIFENLSIHSIDNYKQYILSCNDVFSLNQINEVMLKNYGDEFNWEKILFNTFFIDATSEPNQKAYDIVKKYSNVIFSLEPKGTNFVPAGELYFFLLYKSGAEFAYVELSEAIEKGTTTYAKYFKENSIINKVIEEEYPYMYTHEFQIGDDELAIEVSLAPFVTRYLLNQPILSQEEGEEIEINDDIEFEEIEASTLDTNDDDDGLGF